MKTADARWNGKRVIVTGAGGFLGRSLVARLQQSGCDVIGLTRGDGFRLLEDSLPLEGVDHVFHLAALTGVPDSWDDPVAFHLVNSHGTVRVLDQCRREGCSVTYVGAYVYGVPVSMPISEGHGVDPNNPYAFSKWMGEQACRWFAETYKLPVTAIRLFNVYGAGQSQKFLIPSIVAQALDPATDSISLMDLSPRRDYLYVDDAVDALLASRLESGFAVYNVGSGASYSVKDVVDAVQAAAGTDKAVRATGEARRNEIPDVRADCSRIYQAHGWAARYSLVEGIRAMMTEEAV
ncbi:MAG TPA: NAD(P)-dependent oxidoreductase [Stenotrophomonas sp.]|nr:NAD(P)-dependent oxidoreductase [Stenotrophomonas sp.]